MRAKPRNRPRAHAQAKAAQIAADLRAQWYRAVEMLAGARRIARDTPTGLRRPAPRRASPPRAMRPA